jgi:hypothetical protein
MEMEPIKRIKDQKGMMMLYVRRTRRKPETCMSHSYELHSSLHITEKGHMKLYLGIATMKRAYEEGHPSSLHVSHWNSQIVSIHLASSVSEDGEFPQHRCRERDHSDPGPPPSSVWRNVLLRFLAHLRTERESHHHERSGSLLNWNCH